MSNIHLVPCPHMQGLLNAEHLLRSHAVWNREHLSRLTLALSLVQHTLASTRNGQEPANLTLNRRTRDLHDALCGRIQTVTAHLNRQEQPWKELFAKGRAER